MKNTFYSQGNPYNIVRTTSATYTASVGELIIADETEITLPSGVPAGSVIAVRSSDDSVTTDVVGASGSIDGFSAGTTHQEAKTGEYVYDGSDWYLRNSVDIRDSDIPDSVVTRPDDVGSSSLSRERGVRIETNVTWPQIGGRLSQNHSGGTRAYIYRVSDGQLMGDTGISGNAGDTFTIDLDHDLVDGETYNFVVDAEGATYTNGQGPGDFPYTSADGDLSIVNGADSQTGTSGITNDINEVGDVGF